MIGRTPKLSELVLGETAEALSLHCDEAIDDLSDDDEEDHQDRQVYRDRPYAVSVPCKSCRQVISFICVCGPEAIRTLNRLLSASLSLVCPECCNRY
uniref:Protein E7 n=2 Tax=Kappapapillomavirus 2 TaxID=10623 RepID=O93098_9PAPI|nr:E7 protein [Kappapapillomavirus 2]AHI59152.1 E7 protein [Kappapapillomavirus 2]CAB96115.1 E7 [Kappapapillomavirus 2]